MKMSIKVVIMLLLTALIAVFLASCHGTTAKVAFEIPDDFDSDKEYNIVFWAKNENNATQRDVYNKAIEEFEALYPNIDVTIKHYTSYDDIYNDAITNIQTGTTPNVCITYPDHIATYIEGACSISTALLGCGNVAMIAIVLSFCLFVISPRGRP